MLKDDDMIELLSQEFFIDKTEMLASLNWKGGEPNDEQLLEMMHGKVAVEIALYANVLGLSNTSLQDCRYRLVVLESKVMVEVTYVIGHNPKTAVYEQLVASIEEQDG